MNTNQLKQWVYDTVGEALRKLLRTAPPLTIQESDGIQYLSVIQSQPAWARLTGVGATNAAGMTPYSAEQVTDDPAADPGDTPLKIGPLNTAARPAIVWSLTDPDHGVYGANGETPPVGTVVALFPPDDIRGYWHFVGSDVLVIDVDTAHKDACGNYNATVQWRDPVSCTWKTGPAVLAYPINGGV